MTPRPLDPCRTLFAPVFRACFAAVLGGVLVFSAGASPAASSDDGTVIENPERIEVFPDPVVIDKTHDEAVQNQTQTRVRVGLLQFESAASYTKQLDHVQVSVLRYLQSQFPGLKLEAVPFHSSSALKNAISRGEVEFFLASSGLFVEMQRYGVRDIGTLVTPDLPDPNQCVAGVMVVRSDRSDLTDIASLKGLRAVSTDPANFMTYQTNMGEIANAGYDPDKFFRSVSFTHNDPRQVMRDVAEGRADVGLLRACMPEAIAAKNPELRGRLKVVNQQSVPAGRRLGCAYSTPLYPGWTFAVTPHTPAVITRRMTLALLSMTPADTPGGYTTSFATNFGSVNALFKNLRIGPYDYLRHWTVQRLLETYWPAIVFFLLALLSWVVYAWGLSRIVERRTRALAESLERERAASELARTSSERLNRLERVGMIGRLSSVFAHEFVQPLSAMRYYARSIEKLSERPAFDRELMKSCIEGLVEQLGLATAIIDRVRTYAKGGADRSREIDAAWLARDVSLEMTRSRKLAHEVSVRGVEEAYVRGDAVELRVLFMNLIKNADEAMSMNRTPGEITISVAKAAGDEDTAAVVTVENPGRVLTPEALAAIGEPLASAKEEGLGLGLILCKSIAEAHRARLIFKARPEGGLAVSVLFPKGAEES